MIRGLDVFRERFRGHQGSLVLIGGAACDDWLTREGLAFRATKDLDIVLLLEAVDSSFVTAMRQFIDDGGYEIRRRSDRDAPVLYRFAKPEVRTFPYMLEIFSRVPERVALHRDQRIMPVAIDDGHSLSAILLDDGYYELIREHSELRDGLSFATATALIALKAKAWLDLTARKRDGENVDAKDISKHRADVFRLAGALPGEPGPAIAGPIREDISRFLEAFAEDAEDWSAILAAVKPMLGGRPKPTSLIHAVRTYFRL